MLGLSEKFDVLIKDEVSKRLGMRTRLRLARGIKAFLNPASESIKIDFANNKANKISLFSMSGSLVYQQEVKNQKSKMIDISELPVGIYVLQIVGDDFVVARKVVKE